MSETTTVTLADFLLARITEDEAAANDARRLQDYMPSGAWDLDRVLAECAAKRRVVEEHEEERAYLDAHLHVNGGRLDGLRFAVQSLAAVYADHPDYREDWRP